MERISDYRGRSKETSSRMIGKFVCLSLYGSFFGGESKGLTPETQAGGMVCPMIPNQTRFVRIISSSSASVGFQQETTTGNPSAWFPTKTDKGPQSSSDKPSGLPRTWFDSSKLLGNMITNLPFLFPSTGYFASVQPFGMVATPVPP